MTYDAGGDVNMTYNLTSPANGYIGDNNVTYVRKDVTLRGSPRCAIFPADSI